MSIDQPVVRRDRIRLAGRSTEPTVSAQTFIDAIAPDEVEMFRPLLPVGYAAGVRAYQSAANKLTAEQMTNHYTSGLDFFHDEFTPKVKRRLEHLSGGVWDFDDHIAFAAGSDVDLMTHLVEAVAINERVTLYPSDWYGFKVGCSDSAKIDWDAKGNGALSCLCVPSVRNGHVTDKMVDFLDSSDACLLNLNLYPTLSAEDRASVSRDLLPVIPKSVISISFSRGFGLTASQLGVVLIPKSHPYCLRFERQLNWFTYFYNGIAAQAFLDFDLVESQEIDRARAAWVYQQLAERGLPVVESGSYYVKSFRVDGELPAYLNPLKREDVVRLCFKPPQT